MNHNRREGERISDGNRMAEDYARKDSAQSDNKEKNETEGDNSTQHERPVMKEQNKMTDDPAIPVNNRICNRCGRVGHKSEDCIKPLICGRCKKEGHIPRACEEVLPWECIAPFVGFAAPGQGFHVIQNDGVEESGREMTNCALIKITRGLFLLDILSLNLKHKLDQILLGDGMRRKSLRILFR